MIMTREKDFYKSFFKLTGAVALQNLILLGVGLCDNMMLGAYSETAMSGVAVVLQAQFLLQMTLAGIGTGAAVIAAQYWGQRRTEPIRRIFAVAFWLALGAGLIFCALGLFLPEQVLRLLTDESAVVAQGAVYLRTLAPAYPLFALSHVGVSLFRSVESPRVGVYLSLAALGLDTALNYIFIYGKLGLPAMGARGAAIASLISYAAQFALLAIYAARFDKKLRFRPRDCLSIRTNDFKSYAKTALPLMGSQVSWGIAMNLQSAIIGRLGQGPIAAVSIASSLFQLVSCVIYAAASASHVVIGKAVGQGDIPRVKAYARTLQVLFVGMGLCTAMALFFGRNLVIGVYNIAPGTRGLALQFMAVLSVTVVGTGYQMTCLAGVVSGGGDTRFVLVNDLIFQWGIVLPLSALAAFAWHLPPLWVFIFLKSDQILKCAVAAVKVNRFKWIRDLTEQTP
ncbi:MAG: MATE family efflux transporter [Oscillospiraceae bacterium]|jgi:putative MATE family efflux protein|nr:MATE family efflux transporter [Oscillospiraceae bacterium]